MHILAFAEQRDNQLKKSSFETIQAAKKISDQLGGKFTVLLVGNDVEGLAPELGKYGAERILVVDSPQLAQHSNTAYAKAIAEVAAKEEVTAVFLSASQMGKDLAPRVAVKLNAGLASDCVALKIEGDQVIATRPVYAGKALLDVCVTSPIKVFTLRPNVFTATPLEGAAQAEQVKIDFVDNDFGSVVREMKVAAGRPDVTEADIVVSGGRGMRIFT